ncbi:MAG: DUF6036 family nucleotidyltransferase [Planctomycetota bacterium]|jgi:hypothetical protein
MTRDELEHAIRAACDVSGDTEVYVFGSQAILGQYPDAPVALRTSVEVDIVPKNRPDRVDEIDGALGELSLFHATHGFYVHGLPIEAATLPQGWRGRVIRIQNVSTRQKVGLCLEAHDLAASKLVAFRDKDRAFVRTLLVDGLTAEARLLDRIESLQISSDETQRLSSWVTSTCRDLS